MNPKCQIVGYWDYWDPYCKVPETKDHFAEEAPRLLQDA